MGRRRPAGRARRPARLPLGPPPGARARPGGPRRGLGHRDHRPRLRAAGRAGRRRRPRVRGRRPGRRAGAGPAARAARGPARRRLAVGRGDRGPGRRPRGHARRLERRALRRPARPPRRRRRPRRAGAGPRRRRGAAARGAPRPRRARQRARRPPRASSAATRCASGSGRSTRSPSSAAAGRPTRSPPSAPSAACSPRSSASTPAPSSACSSRRCWSRRPALALPASFNRTAGARSGAGSAHEPFDRTIVRARPPAPRSAATPSGRPSTPCWTGRRRGSRRCRWWGSRASASRCWSTASPSGRGRAGMQVAVGRCSADDGAPPLWPWRSVLTDLDRLSEVTAPADATAPASGFATWHAIADAVVGCRPRDAGARGARRPALGRRGLAAHPRPPRRHRAGRRPAGRGGHPPSAPRAHRPLRRGGRGVRPPARRPGRPRRAARGGRRGAAARGARRRRPPPTCSPAGATAPPATRSSSSSSPGSAPGRPRPCPPPCATSSPGGSPTCPPTCSTRCAPPPSVGRRAHLAIVAAAGDVDTDTAADRLDVAVAAGLVSETGPEEYAFVHALTQEAVAAGLTGTQAARRHARVARALGGAAAAVMDPAEVTSELADHWLAAGPSHVESAWRAARAAAVQARRLTSYAEAMALREAAVEAHRRVPGADLAVRYDLLLELVTDAALAAALADVGAGGGGGDRARPLARRPGPGGRGGAHPQRLQRVAAARPRRGARGHDRRPALGAGRGGGRRRGAVRAPAGAGHRALLRRVGASPSPVPWSTPGSRSPGGSTTRGWWRGRCGRPGSPRGGRPRRSSGPAGPTRGWPRPGSPATPPSSR